MMVPFQPAGITQSSPMMVMSPWSGMPLARIEYWQHMASCSRACAESQVVFAHTGCAFASTLARNFGGRSAGSSDEGHGHAGPDQFPLHIIRRISFDDIPFLIRSICFFNLCVNADMQFHINIMPPP